MNNLLDVRDVQPVATWYSGVWYVPATPHRLASGKSRYPTIVSPSTLHLPSLLTHSPLLSHTCFSLTLIHNKQMTRKRPVSRCTECGSVYRMEYIGPPDDPHAEHDDAHHYEEPKTFADYVRPEYWGTPQPHYKKKS